MMLLALLLTLISPSVLAETAPEVTPAPEAAPAATPTVPTAPEPAPETVAPAKRTIRGEPSSDSGPRVKAVTGEEPKLPPKAETKPSESQTSPQAAPQQAPPSAPQADGGQKAPEVPTVPPAEKLSPEKKKRLEIFSQEPTIAPPSQPTGKAEALLETRISLDLRDIDLMDALKYLSIKANLNMVASPEISGSVNLLLNDVSLVDAIDIILSANRLAYSIKENIMRVMSEEEYKALYGKEFYDKRETKIVRLKYASAKNVGAMLEHTKSTIGRVVYDESTGTVVMTDTPEKIVQMEEVIRHEELPTVVRLPPTQTEIFELHYAKADKVSEQVTPALTPELGKIYVDERTSRLIVSDLPHKIDEFRQLVRALDTKTREVFIQAKIIQIQLNDRFQAGVDWSRIADGALQQSFPLSLQSFGEMTLGSIEPQTTTNADGTTSTTFTGSGIVMKFLETFGKANILSTPQIAVLDGEEAKIMVGTKEAYTTSSVTQSQATTTTAQQVTFVDVGVTLHVTPSISPTGFITMKIKPEVSSVTRFVTTAQGDQIPIVETTNAETTVMVKDGATVLIGGLMGTRRTKTRQGIPILSRIPLMGLLFRSTDDRSENTELSVLLTPHIMNGEESLPGTRAQPVARVDLPPAGVGIQNVTEGPSVKTGPEESYPQPRSRSRRSQKFRSRR